MITDRELILATAKREKQERLLYYAEFEGECTVKTLQHYGCSSIKELAGLMGFFSPEWMHAERKPDAPVYDYSKYFTDINIPGHVKINRDGVLQIPGSTYHFTHTISPLRNIDDLEKIQEFPYYKKPEHFDCSHFSNNAEAAHAKGNAAACWVGRFFETSWQYRGYENLLADMIAEPEIAEYLFQKDLEWNLYLTEKAVSAGADILYFGDDVGSQKGMTFSAALWRKMIKPLWAKVFEKARSINKNIVLWYHSCGDVTEIVPDLIEVGLDILNPLQPECMDIYTIQKKYGNVLSFDGGLGTQTVMPFGTTDDVVRETARLVEIFGANGGFILSPSHVLEPEVPMDNIIAFMEIAQKLCRR